MNENQDIKKKLTREEIDAEIEKIGGFFDLIPDELKSEATEKFIFEIVNWGSFNHYEALGIFEEAQQRYRLASLAALQELEEELEFKKAQESAVAYVCIKENNGVDIGETCFIGLVGESKNFGGGKKYFVFTEDSEEYFAICQNALEEYFELIEE
jgi:hypothetical protein